MRPICIEPVPALSPICWRWGTEEIREAIDTDFDRSGAAVLRGGAGQMESTFRKRASQDGDPKRVPFDCGGGWTECSTI